VRERERGGERAGGGDGPEVDGPARLGWVCCFFFFFSFSFSNPFLNQFQTILNSNLLHDFKFKF
jgi:hypothetical protein